MRAMTNRFTYQFNCANIERDFRIFKIVTSQDRSGSYEDASAARRKAADILVNAGVPIRAAVYSGKAASVHGNQRPTFGVYLLTDKRKVSIDRIHQLFDEHCSGMGLKLEQCDHVRSLKDHDPNTLANLLLYSSVNQINYFNANGALYYAVDEWINAPKSGKPKDIITLLRLRFKANGVLCTEAQTWQKVRDGKDNPNGPIFCRTGLDRACRFIAMTPNVKTVKNSIRYFKKGIHGRRAGVPYLNFTGSKNFNASECGAIYNALEAVKRCSSEYLTLTPVVYDDCRMLKDRSIAKYRVYKTGKKDKQAFSDGWENLVSGASVCICAGCSLTDREKESTMPFLEKLAENLGNNGHVKVQLDLEQTLSDAVREDPSQYFIPVIHDKILQGDWKELAKAVQDVSDLPNVSLYQLMKVQPMFDDHYTLMRDFPELYEAVKYQIQHITIEGILKAPKVDDEARRIRIELLIKHDMKMKKLDVFDWTQLIEKEPLHFVSRKKIIMGADRKTYDEYDRWLYTVMTIYPDGMFNFRTFYTSADDDELETRDIKVTDQDTQIAKAFTKDEEKILNAQEFLSSKNIGALYVFRESPDEGFLIADAPEKLLPDLPRLKNAIETTGIKEEDQDEIFQGHLAAAWISQYSNLIDEALCERFNATRDQFPMDYETLFRAAGVKEKHIPQITWHFSSEKTHQKLLQKENQAKIDQILTPYVFSYDAAMKMCDYIPFYSAHPTDAQMYQQFFGIRYVAQNHPKASNIMRRLDEQCGGVLINNAKSDNTLGVKTMGNNFYRFITEEDEPLPKDTGIAMYYCGIHNPKQSIDSGRYWRFVLPTNGKQLSEAKMDKIVISMDTDLITSDNSTTVYPFMLKYLREYAELTERQYRCSVAKQFAKQLPGLVKEELAMKVNDHSP